MDRFWDKVEIRSEEECWPWKLNTSVSGYGIFWCDGKNVKAHRHALRITKGDPEDEALKALHSCDNPPCCNPSHLRWGTAQDNSDDMVLRKRSAFGQNSGLAQISEETASHILRMRVDGLRVNEIAAVLSISRDLVMNIYTGRTWSHLHGVNGNPSLDELKRSRPKTRAIAHNRVLTDEMVDKIFQGRMEGMTCPMLAKELGLKLGTVSPVYSGFAFTERLGKFGNPTKEELLAFRLPPRKALTDEELEEVLSLLREGYTAVSIAKKFGVGKATISRIKSSSKL